MIPLGADFVDPAIVNARLMVIAHRREAPVANFADGWVFDRVLHLHLHFVDVRDILTLCVSVCNTV